MVPKMAIQAIRNIRHAWPAPTCDIGAVDGYCVGGALGRAKLGLFEGLNAWWYKYSDRHLSFPVVADLAETLIAWNPILPKRISMMMAFDIITLNDRGKFDEAWNIAEGAFSYPHVGWDADLPLNYGIFLRSDGYEQGTTEDSAGEDIRELCEVH